MYQVVSIEKYLNTNEIGSITEMSIILKNEDDIICLRINAQEPAFKVVVHTKVGDNIELTMGDGKLLSYVNVSWKISYKKK